MSNTNKCIICKKNDSNSIEHIIPEALGNKVLKINRVCKKCNDLLGQKVDSKLTNFVYAEWYRWENKIAGKTGKIPNPFSEGITEDGRKVRIDENFKTHLVTPIINIEKIDDDSADIHFEGNVDTDAIIAIQKKLKRMKLPELSDSQIEKIKSSCRTVNKKCTITLTDFDWDDIKAENLVKLAYMKIAYELGYFLWGDAYLEDMVAEEIRERIYNCIYNNVIADDLDCYFSWGKPLLTLIELVESLSEEKNSLPGKSQENYLYRHVIVSTDKNMHIMIIDERRDCRIRYYSNDIKFSQFRALAVYYPSREIFRM